MTHGRVLVCGGRKFDDRELFLSVMNRWRANYTYPYDPCGKSAECFMQIIAGEATGADALAKRYAEVMGLKYHPFPADWTDLSHPDAVIKTRRDGTKYDAKAGSRRNQRMLDEGKPGLVIAFPGGTGTADMVRRAKRAGVPVVEIAP